MKTNDVRLRLRDVCNRSERSIRVFMIATYKVGCRPIPMKPDIHAVS
jgi:hypothetical protein